MPFPVEKSFIERTEQVLGTRFPESYIAAMRRSNGGLLETDVDIWQLFPIFDDSDKTRLKRTCNDVVRETKSAREWRGFPADGIAIASNGSGDLLIFLPNESEGCLSSIVYCWHHETGELTSVVNDFAELASHF